MIAATYRFLLTFIALLLTFAVFLINKEFILNPYLPGCLKNLPMAASYITYIALCVFFTWVSLLVANMLSEDKMQEGSIIELEQVNDTFLPSYLGYFFVALSTTDLQIFLIVFSILLVLVFFSRAAYFNPLFFIFRFQFYSATTDKNVKILIVTKKSLKIPKEIEFNSIKRINNFTFIDLEKH